MLSIAIYKFKVFLTYVCNILFIAFAFNKLVIFKDNHILQIEDIKSEIVMSATYKENFNRTHDENEQLKNKIKILETKLEFADVAGS